MDANLIMLSILFGSIGTGMFMYGRSQVDLRYVVAGIVLMVFPYFMPSALWTGVAGILITAAPFFVG